MAWDTATAGIKVKCMIDNVKKGQIREFLISLAQKKTTTGYLKLNEKLKLGLDFSSEPHMNELYDALDALSASSYTENKVLLGILIVNKMRNRPSARFFAGVERILGVKVEDTDAFFENERERLFEFYARK